jgi:hypothetical protein
VHAQELGVGADPHLTGLDEADSLDAAGDDDIHAVDDDLLGRGRVQRVTGVREANAKVGKLVVKSKLPKLGQPKSDHYEGDGYVIVRHPDDEVVKQAMKTIIETIRIEYA